MFCTIILSGKEWISMWLFSLLSKAANNPLTHNFMIDQSYSLVLMVQTSINDKTPISQLVVEAIVYVSYMFFKFSGSPSYHGLTSAVHSTWAPSLRCSEEQSKSNRYICARPSPEKKMGIRATRIHGGLISQKSLGLEPWAHLFCVLNP